MWCVSQRICICSALILYASALLGLRWSLRRVPLVWGRMTTWRLSGGMLLIGCLALHSVQLRVLHIRLMYYQRKSKTCSDHIQLSKLSVNWQPCTEASRRAADGDSMMSALHTVQAIKPVSQLFKSCRWRIRSKMKQQVWKCMIKQDVPTSTFAISYKRNPGPAVS